LIRSDAVRVPLIHQGVYGDLEHARAGSNELTSLHGVVVTRDTPAAGFAGRSNRS
jgi:hypothetical protein